jgi:glycosyltransferase involved in cell wall biosynthesis
VPVKVVPHPVVVPPVPRFNRQSFGLPDNCFIALTMVDLCSSIERKNPIGAIRAFRAAFERDNDALLLVKVSNADKYPQQLAQITGEAEGLKNVRVILDRFDSDRQYSFINCADVVISLHRSEGFGLVLAEALLMRKPVIATGYSGNMDFMDHECAAIVGFDLVPVVDPQGIYTVPACQWAEPRIVEAVTWLKRLREDPHLRFTMGEAGYRRAKEMLSIESYRNAMHDSNWLIKKLDS